MMTRRTRGKDGEKSEVSFQMSCPLPFDKYPQVVVAHGGGGRLMNELIRDLFFAAFDNLVLAQAHDAAAIELPPGRVAFTTDSYVVHPLFFPGGDIGSMAVFGTVNDLAMAGARPLYLSAGFILEEGLPMETLWKIAQSMRAAADRAGVRIVTGDTKVVDRGKGDSVFINTAGVGSIESPSTIGPREVKPGDAIIVSGDLGRHGMAILSVREGLEFEGTIESDSAPVAGVVLDLLASGVEIHCLRDLTRGGLASALVEIAETASLRIGIDERRIPCRPDVKGICEILGFDPLHVANEGRFVAFVPADDAERAVEIMKRHEEGREATVIGAVGESVRRGQVIMRSLIGASRIVDMLSGEQLPRIC
jgi:hydrogenase expression/formation protein HypE